MPDTRVKMDSVMKNMGSMTTYAVPELLVMSGFYVVVFMEQIIKTLYVKAQQSDVNRTLRKQRRPKPEPEAKRPVQVFRSTLDEDVNPDEPPTDRKICSDDDDEDDDDDNVLIDDEDDLSFDDSDTDRNSLDSVTRVKENLLDKEKERATEKSEFQKNAANFNIASTNSHSHPMSGFNLQQHQQQQHLTRHSKSVSEQDAQILKTFGQHPIIDTLPKVAIVNCRPYQNSGVPTIHTHVQQRSPLPSLNHHQLHNHVQKKEEPQQQQLHNGHSTAPRNSSPPLPPTPQIYAQQPDWQQQQLANQQSANRPQLSQETKQHWPAITSQDHVGDEIDVNQDGSRSQPSCHVTVCVERGRGSEAESFSPKHINTEPDKDVDSGVFSTRRDCEIAEQESPDKPSRPASRDNSFDRISESSSVLQDIQVKRVVDELSRSDDSSRAHFRSILYIMALSFHGIFEGMALGLQSMKSSVWALCFAIVVHRCVLAFKLGMDLCRGEEKQGTAFLCIGVFTLISTLGIIIGIVISSGASLYSNVSVPEAILQSLATGTIFYIVFFDILFKDLEGKDDLKRVSSSFVGFSLMAIVFAITKS
ncbi:unnamed protein product [Lymnaea stagnalis]|uniref:Uncharacterized protein n=1 Tax=Lymnaea stagnalis TaxID=6523 RepID=A0AAV2IC20_LYMST